MSSSAQKLIRRGHQLELLQQAKQLCDQQEYVDLTIYCEDGVVRAHQMLLATASPFLKLLFQTSPLYGVDDISLILPEVKACLVQALVHFVYTGTVVSKEDHFYSLMKLVYALNMNASIEAESTNEKPTTFSAPLVADVPSRNTMKLPPQLLSSQPVMLSAQNPLPAAVSLPSQPVAMPQLPTQPLATPQAISLPTQPVPPAKMPKLSSAAVTMPPPTITASPKVPAAIQLPTQPVPLSGMVNGSIKQEQPQHHHHQQQHQQQQSYIAVDPTTGLSYKVEMANGPVATADASDPLAAIMNETIFTDTSGGILPKFQAVYSSEGGQIVYQGPAQPGATAVVSAQPIATAAPVAVPVPTASTSSASSAGASPAKGKKRKAGGNKENAVLTDTVEDLPCAPDDEDLNTPYPCDQCNKTIKGRVMLQAHQYQEHYDNPELNNMDLGDKHACRVCLKLFTRNSDVKAHILRVHCGDRRYPCTMCGKRFKESTHLRKHLYTHTGERPHYCTLCNKGFQTSSDLKRHKRTRVHQERVEQAGGEGDGEADDVDGSDEEMGNADESSASMEPPTATKSSPDAANNSLPHHPAAAAVTTSAAGAAGAAAAAAATTASAFSSSSSTIDMKALGGTTAWNNNAPSSAARVVTTSAPSLPAPAAASAAPAVTAAPTAAPTAAAAPAAASTLDLKAISNATDVNSKWQEQQQKPPPPPPPPPPPQAVAVKRSSSLDSPGQDEERLTVVEGDESSQDSVGAAGVTAAATNNGSREGEVGDGEGDGDGAPEGERGGSVAASSPAVSSSATAASVS